MGMSLPMTSALRQAREGRCAREASQILIIEDEPVIALDIASTVRERPLRRGHRRDPANAVEVADQEDPELILADIQLADDSSGLEAVQEILQGAACRWCSSPPSPSAC